MSPASPSPPSLPTIFFCKNRISAFQHPMFLHKDWPQHLEQSFGAMATSIIYHITVFCVTYLIMVDRIHHLHTSSTPFNTAEKALDLWTNKGGMLLGRLHNWSSIGKKGYTHFSTPSSAFCPF
jgi:hypothetical protein